MSPALVAGIAPIPFGDGPFIDIGVYAADGNVNWDGNVFDQDPRFGGTPGPYLYGSFSTSPLGTPTQNAARWWWRDFGPGGIWDMKVIHVTGFDVGVYSFRIDDVEIARLDGYSLVDVNNIEKVFTGIRISAGRHKFSIVMVATNPAFSGNPYYPGIQGVLFRRIAAIAPAPTYGSPKGRRSPSGGGQVINIFPCFATGNTNWDNLAASTQMVNDYECYSTSAQNAARWWDLDLVAGQWDLDMMVATFNQAGIISVQLDGVTQATIDTYSASTIFSVRKTARLSVVTSGTHRLTLLMATKNGSSSAYYGDLSNLQLRQVWPGNPRALPPRIVNWAAFWAHGNVAWDTSAAAHTQVYGGQCASSGAQTAARWWYVNLAAGTWDFSLLYSGDTSSGIFTVMIDDVAVGTIDGYRASSTLNIRSTITGIKVASSGQHKVSLVMLTKNGSAGSYVGAAQAMQLRRTA